VLELAVVKHKTIVRFAHLIHCFKSFAARISSAVDYTSCKVRHNLTFYNSDAFVNQVS